MTAQETTYTRRIFRYGDKSFPDPGREYTPEQILVQLKGY
jgi:hypothetical protein